MRSDTAHGVGWLRLNIITAIIATGLATLVKSTSEF